MTNSAQTEVELLPAAKLTVFIGGDERFEHQPLHQTVTNILGQTGIKGVTVTKGFMSYGSRRQIHSGLNEITMDNLPVVIEAVDEKEKIDQATAQIVELMGGRGLIQIQPTTIKQLHGEGSTE